MTNLVPLTPKQMKKLGIVSTEEGIMIDKKRLIEITKFQRSDKEDPHKDQVIKKVKVQDMIKETVNRRDEDLGIF